MNVFGISACVVFLCIPYVMCMPEEMQEMMNSLHAACVAETGVSEDVIASASKGNFAEDPKLKCYMKCYLVQTAAMTDDGVLDIEALVAMMPDNMKEHAEPTIRKCGSKVGADPCDNAFQTHKCWYENNPEHFFII